jgi:hypothetical protein
MARVRESEFNCEAEFKMLRILAVPIAVIVLACAVPAQTMSNPLGDDSSKFDEKLEASALHNDLAFFQAVLSDDVRFTHGTGLVQDRAKWLDDVPKAKYLVRELDSVEVEPHADVVETTGHVHVKTSRSEYHIWYVRVYAKREGRWQLLSNRTVRQEGKYSFLFESFFRRFGLIFVLCVVALLTVLVVRRRSRATHAGDTARI